LRVSSVAKSWRRAGSQVWMSSWAARSALIFSRATVATHKEQMVSQEPSGLWRCANKGIFVEGIVRKSYASPGMGSVRLLTVV